MRKLGCEAVPGASDLSEGCRGEEKCHRLHLQGMREWRNSSLAVAFVFRAFLVLPQTFRKCLVPGRWERLLCPLVLLEPRESSSLGAPVPRDVSGVLQQTCLLLDCCAPGVTGCLWSVTSCLWSPSSQGGHPHRDLAT